METIANRLPMIFGSGAGLLVAGIGMLTQATAMTCATRAGAAYAVFAAFGIVLRYLLALAAEHAGQEAVAKSAHSELDHIEPGTSVEELLART